MSFLNKTRVGVLRGGPSPEYEVSLNTGKTILANLPDEYEPLDIFISKDGLWYMGGVEREPHQILPGLDVAINAMHGSYGEDGKVQKLLEQFQVPYTGSNSLSSALGMNKAMAKNIFNKAGLKTPHHIVLERNDEDDITRAMISKINESLPFPMIVKPLNSGSSLGISRIDRPSQIKQALKNSFANSPRILVEEFIDGKEATCGVIEGFRDKELYTLLPVEIIKSFGKNIHDYNSKYIDLGRYHETTHNFREDEATKIQEAAALAHQSLGLRHYSRSDFIVHPKRGLFVLEVNTLPELTHRSSFVKSLEAVGSNIKEFLSHLLHRTLHKK